MAYKKKSEEEEVKEDVSQIIDGKKEEDFDESELIVEVKLPSMGLPYGIDEIIQMKPMRTTEEKYFSSMAAATTPHRILTQVLKAVTNLTIDPMDLLIDDRLYLLFYIRGITYSPEYRVQLTCTNPLCLAKFPHIYNIFDVPVKYLTPDKVTYDLKLPVCRRTITVKRMTGRDEVALSEFEKTLNRTRGKMSHQEPEGDESYIHRLALQIAKIEGKDVNFSESLAFVKKMIGKDSLLLRNTVDDELLGISLEMEVQCPKCGEIFERVLPMTAEFFRPKTF